MDKAVKKSSISERLASYKIEFMAVQNAAVNFEEQDHIAEDLRHLALEAVFTFGEKIRTEPQVLHDFVRENGLPWNAVTAKNPYNALVRLAFPADARKAWRSQCSTVLAYAHDLKVNEPLSQWLQDGGVTRRYAQAVEHFARSSNGKAGRSRALRLETAKERLIGKPLSAAIPNIAVNSEQPGFFRSLVYFDGHSTRLVHVADASDDTATEAYLLNLVGPTDISDPLADRHLYELYRAIDLIIGTCGTPNADQTGILIYNDIEADKDVTRLRLISSAHTFTNATVTLATPIYALYGKKPLLLAFYDAQRFRREFQQDADWQFVRHGAGVNLVNDARSATQLCLKLAEDHAHLHQLRVGVTTGRRSKHFRLPIDNMRSALANVSLAQGLAAKKSAGGAASYPTPNRLLPSIHGDELRLSMREAPSIETRFLELKKPGATLYQHRDFAIADIERLCQTLIAYKDDVTGYFADGDVEDAAFCICHDFLNGDRFEYHSPLVISVRMDRTDICEPFSVPMILDSTGHTPMLDYPKPLRRTRESRREKAAWPTDAHMSGDTFGAFITSYLPNDPDKRLRRKFDFEWQLEWWRRMTDIPVHVIASNWHDHEVETSNELTLLAQRGGSITREPARPLIENRINCLKALYDSPFDWGIIMDDDAVLYNGTDYNSGASLFSEMAANNSAAYDGIDVFYPINPGKANSQGPLWREAPSLFQDQHVFDPEYDLKGSLFVVRNFRKAGRAELLPPADFDLHGEDTQFAIQAVSMGYSVRRCGNIVLQELNVGESQFLDRANQMKKGNERIAEMYADKGLRMHTSKGREHLLDRSEFLSQVGRAEDERLSVPKPQAVTAEKFVKQTFGQ